MKFRNQEHKERFYALFEQMTCHDVYHKSAAYLLTLDDVLYKHVGEIYGFDEFIIYSEKIGEGWQTDTSVKTFRLMTNLWNNRSCDHGDKSLKSSSCYAIAEIFDSEYAPFYWEAIKLRFSWIDCMNEGIADD